jgi:MFS transporter, DHA3 family, macrolide efflux protein
MASAPTPMGFRELLQLKSMRRLWAAQIVSIFGDFLAIFAVFSVVTFRLHGTATQVSMILVAYFIPMAFVGPLAGVFVDRWNVKRTMIASDLIRAALVLLLVFVTDLKHIYLIFFALSAVSSFFIPAQSITVRTIIPQAGLMSANALMTQAIQLTQIVSPFLAGTLTAWLGANSCFWFDSFSFLFSAAMLLTIAVDHKPTPGQNDVRSIVRSMSEGMTFIFTHAAISFVIISMTAGMFAIRCFGALIAVYVRDILASGSFLFGSLSSLVGAGMITGTQLINRFARRRSKNHLVVAGLLGIGLSILEVAAFGSVITTVIGMFAVGFCVAFIMIPAQTLLQEETPRPMLGRVSSSMMSVLSIAQIIAMVGAGPVAERLGIRNLYFASGVLLLLIAGAGYLQLRKPLAASAAGQG